MNAFDSVKGWPVDSDGKPMVLISAGVGEKIGLPNFSNVDITPISVTKFVPEGTEKEAYDEAFALVETVLGEERAKVLASLQETK
jgi:hypothetical protein